MKDFLLILGLVAVWIILNKVVFPRLGIQG